MRISDWSSDVCSSDLANRAARPNLVACLDTPPSAALGMNGVGGASGVCPLVPRYSALHVPLAPRYTTLRAALGRTGGWPFPKRFSLPPIIPSARQKAPCIEGLGGACGERIAGTERGRTVVE